MSPLQGIKIRERMKACAREAGPGVLEVYPCGLSLGLFLGLRSEALGFNSLFWTVLDFVSQMKLRTKRWDLGPFTGIAASTDSLRHLRCDSYIHSCIHGYIALIKSLFMATITLYPTLVLHNLFVSHLGDHLGNI